MLAHFNNCLDETPYCVAVDHTWQSIIITIRGTHSFEVRSCICEIEDECHLRCRSLIPFVSPGPSLVVFLFQICRPCEEVGVTKLPLYPLSGRLQVDTDAGCVNV